MLVATRIKLEESLRMPVQHWEAKEELLPSGYWDRKWGHCLKLFHPQPKLYSDIYYYYFSIQTLSTEVLKEVVGLHFIVIELFTIACDE